MHSFLDDFRTTIETAEQRLLAISEQQSEGPASGG